MKIKTIIDDKKVTINLTKEQLSDIKKQTSNIVTIDNINNYVAINSRMDYNSSTIDNKCYNC